MYLVSSKYEVNAWPKRFKSRFGTFSRGVVGLYRILGHFHKFGRGHATGRLEYPVKGGFGIEAAFKRNTCQRVGLVFSLFDLLFKGFDAEAVNILVEIKVQAFVQDVRTAFWGYPKVVR